MSRDTERSRRLSEFTRVSPSGREEGGERWFTFASRSCTSRHFGTEGSMTLTESELRELVEYLDEHDVIGEVAE